MQGVKSQFHLATQAHHKRNLKVGVNFGQTKNRIFKENFNVLKDRHYWTVSCKTPFWKTAKHPDYHAYEVQSVSVMGTTTKPKDAKTGPPASRHHVYAFQVQHRDKPCLRNIPLSLISWAHTQETRIEGQECETTVQSDAKTCSQSKKVAVCKVPSQTQRKETVLWDL